MSSSDTKRGFRGFLQRMGRAALKLLIFVTAIVILIGVGVLGYNMFETEITTAVQQRTGNDTQRINTNSERIFEIQNDLTRLQGAEIPDFAAGISDVSSGLDSIAGRVLALEESLAAAEAENAALKTALETAVSDSTTEITAVQEAAAAANSLGETALQDVAAIQDTLRVLQSDMNDNGERIDSLGGEVDTINGSLTSLESSLTTGLATIDTVVAASAEAETLRDGTLRQTLTLFRAWQLVARARLHLVEENAGLAIADVEAAVTTVEQLAANSSEPALLAQLDAVQSRLALALLDLPERPSTATSDLENAWEALDAALSDLVVPLVAAADEAELPDADGAEPAEGEAAEPEDETDEAADEAADVTATPDGSATPEPTTEAEESTPTPTPTEAADDEAETPTPTPSPTPTG